MTMSAYLEPMLTNTRNLLFFVLFFLSSATQAQQRINGSFPFQSEPEKDYAIYIPSNYEEGVPHRLMVGMHPLNTARWDAISWCDTLVAFAEENQLLLVCPDGGADGSVDDPIDHEFTTALLDSMRAWYNVDAMKTYIMGFSFGGKATYRYGLANPDVFGGYLPIGAAVDGTSDVDATLQANSIGKPVYIVHGSLDSPGTRYTPVLNALTNSGAIVNSVLMSGVGHTIDFPDRNTILGTAFQWIDSVNCAAIVTGVGEVSGPETEVLIFPSIVERAGTLSIRSKEGTSGSITVSLIDLRGTTVLAKKVELAKGGTLEVSLAAMVSGTYVVRVSGAVQGIARVVLR